MLKHSIRSSGRLLRVYSLSHAVRETKPTIHQLQLLGITARTMSSTSGNDVYYSKLYQVPLSKSAITVAAVTLAIACGLGYSTLSSNDDIALPHLNSSTGLNSWLLAHCDSEYYSVAEVGRIMREKLANGRDKLRKQGRPIPRITVRAINFPDRNGHETETQVMDMSFDQSTIKSITSLLSHWVDAMDDKQAATGSTTGSTSTKKREMMQSFKEFYANKKQLTLPIVSSDKSSSMTITKYIGPSDYDRHDQTTKLSISIFKDNGFSMKHIESIVKGYEEGFDVNNNKTTKSNKKGNGSSSSSSRDEDEGLVFGMDQDVSEAIDAQNKLKSVLEKYFNRGRKEGTGEDDDEHTGTIFGGFPSSSNRQSQETSGSNTNANTNTSNAVEGLRSMGIEVSDKESNEKFTWDYLAGYNHIKQEIEDTVINALKHPEIYDEIAKQTRLHYESNRPKAILLEGPPGTGKTLTARILASEVEAPLVIIKLESIVSKWYGDSEKKLSKILDYCDQLTNTIIFVDEIDALTQSRDNENGIHEVSKRILSILLQRLEGFHGKSKSLLICTTNRKQDLDRALISRFDLVIPYDLPDLSTRMEIFRRYAKQLMMTSVVPAPTTGAIATPGATTGGGSESQPNVSTNNSNKNPYEILGKVSEGLSCRDLKEICEYAERKCASRLVKYKIQQEQKKKKNDNQQAQENAQSSTSTWWSIVPKGDKKGNNEEIMAAPSSLPTLDDYLDSIRYRNMERHSLADKFGNRPEPYSSV